MCGSFSQYTSDRLTTLRYAAPQIYSVTADSLSHFSGISEPSKWPSVCLQTTCAPPIDAAGGLFKRQVLFTCEPTAPGNNVCAVDKAAPSTDDCCDREASLMRPEAESKSYAQRSTGPHLGLAQPPAKRYIPMSESVFHPTGEQRFGAALQLKRCIRF
jgi:hypothetical protein